MAGFLVRTVPYLYNAGVGMLSSMMKHAPTQGFAGVATVAAVEASPCLGTLRPASLNGSGALMASASCGVEYFQKASISKNPPQRIRASDVPDPQCDGVPAATRGKNKCDA